MFSFLTRLLLFNRAPVPRFNQLAPIPPAQTKAQRRAARFKWWTYRRQEQRIGPPKLTGARLLRTISNCTGVPLSVLQTGTQ